MSQPSIKTIALCAAAVIGTAAAIYYLSKDQGAALDKSKHTKENLLRILNELHLEYTCIYARYYNTMLRFKDEKKWNEGLKNKLEADLFSDLKEKNASVCAYNEGERDSFRNNLTPELLEEWTKTFKDEPEVKQLAKNINKLHEDVFTRGKVE